jgi:hypothetical protein
MERKELEKIEDRRDYWEFAIDLMRRTDDPAMIEKIATILAGKSVDH